MYGTFSHKNQKGSPYLYVREIARVDGKPKVISQIYIGSPQKVAGLLSGKETDTVKLKVEEFGALWLANQIDRDVDLCSIVDGVVLKAERETGPSVGEYFLYCVLNRMIQAVSKNKLADWYRKTAIQHIRPVDLDEITSKRYWEKWDRVSETDLHVIVRSFFECIWQVEAPAADCLLSYRTKGEYGGKERTVIVTYTPAFARKQAYTFADKLEAMRQELFEMRAKVRDKAPHWRKEETVRERYIRFCEHLHMLSQLYELKFEQSPDGLSMSFHKDAYLVSRKQAMFGKNIIITDNTDWLTGDIIEANLARWQVEDRFRLSRPHPFVKSQLKADDLRLDNGVEAEERREITLMGEDTQRWRCE